MMPLRTARYGEGDEVVALSDLLNDGSYPGAGDNVLLVEAGRRGIVVQVGMHVDSRTPIYMVEFAGGTVLGCLEEEIMPAGAARDPAPAAPAV
ncbi:MAG: hypothetical protein IOMNBAOH_00415 [Rhodocyclaceae bacterium]|jgi:nitrogen fixation protein NifZ|nr:hypothetical protein [Rhodocyclaceae bacterium]